MGVITILYLVFIFIALYMFFFYIILILKNRGKMFDYPKPNKTYKVSVLVAAYNEEGTIKGTIESIINSDYDKEKIEVIVINDGSKDGTSKIVRKLMTKYSNLVLIDKEKNTGKADSLNQGIKKSTGELIAVVDADSYPKEDSIMKLTGFFDDKKVGAATSAVLLKHKKKFIEKIQAIEYVVLAWTRKLLDFLDAVYVTNGPLSMYRKEALIKANGFDPKSVTEDIEITWHILSLGYKTKMCLDAIVYTSAPNKFKRWYRQRERWGIGGIQTIIKYKWTFFRKGLLGYFVLPFVSFIIFLSMFAFLFGLYLIFRSLLSIFLSAKYSYTSKVVLLRMQDINLNPSILLFFLFVLFTTSWIYNRFILMSMKHKDIAEQEFWKVFNRFFYILIYLTLYPVVWFTSVYRIIKGDLKW
ncbi:MAG TPA: glycosyltransferase family 2 protein [Candidatus Pacearchaeota archaeon]|nr:poly-beta-1,6-N-acetyl-D-glucosamine synthase [archaeon BMS3Abin17]HDK41755.1 glycosyltransferase family 2 protein [Candidatus Pacearchaeota archaeon]HDZ60606.1 glycosyltransferase family 2 protein [Candidatus Pacearchaeota archaeon]